MVHCFKYVHKGKNIHFLYDIESGSLLNVDKNAYLVAKATRGQLLRDEIVSYNDISAAEKVEISDELDQLVSQGVIDVPDTTPKQDKQIGEIKALCLHICHDCNMRCRYCFAGEGNYHSARNYMSLEVGRKAIDFLIKNSGKRHNLEVDFFGGEPLMNLDVVRGIVEYARAQEDIYGKVFSFTMTTNCLLLNDSNIEWLNKEMHNVVLSIDGRREVHNKVRKTVGGKDAYDIVLSNAKKFAAVRGDKSYYVRGTFTAENLDFASDVLYLREQGFTQISVEPVVLEDGHPLAIKATDIDTIIQEYTRLAAEYIECRRDGVNKWFNFFHFMLDLEGGPCIKKRLTGCGAGCEYLAVTPMGDIYPCHQFAEIDGYSMGNVLSGEFCLDISKVFAANTVMTKQSCKDCPAKYYCSGGCVANAINFGGGMDKVFEPTCRMMRARFELALAISAIENSID